MPRYLQFAPNRMCDNHEINLFMSPDTCSWQPTWFDWSRLRSKMQFMATQVSPLSTKSITHSFQLFFSLLGDSAPRLHYRYTLITLSRANRISHVRQLVTFAAGVHYLLPKLLNLLHSWPWHRWRTLSPFLPDICASKSNGRKEIRTLHTNGKYIFNVGLLYKSFWPPDATVFNSASASTKANTPRHHRHARCTREHKNSRRRAWNSASRPCPTDMSFHGIPGHLATTKLRQVCLGCII